MVDNPLDRPFSTDPCIYWRGTACGAGEYFAPDKISCYTEGACNGFGTCRGCSKYDQGGLKLASSDGEDGSGQTPMNLRVYNLRARIAPCCLWDGNPVDFNRNRQASLGAEVECSHAFYNAPEGATPGALVGSLEVHATGDVSKFPVFALVRVFNGDATVYVGTYTSKVENETDTTFTFSNVAHDADLPQSPPITLMVIRELTVGPSFVVETAAPDTDEGEVKTSCTLAAAAPWQVAFTDDNPTAYGCNGAKTECPFYTGPKFTEVVDEKMDTGNRVSAKQIMELRFYSDNWRNYGNPREVWEARFEHPDIWAWARGSTPEDGVPDDTPGPGLSDEFGNPMLQKVSVASLTAETPQFVVGAVVPATDGTPTIDQPPNYPDLVRELFLFPTGMKVLWPPGTTIDEPFVRRTFTSSERYMYIAVALNSSRSSYAVNLTQHPQDGLSDGEFIAQLLRTDFEDAILPFLTGLPGKTFAVPLVTDGKVDSLNHIKIFLDVGADDGTMLTEDIYVRHIFHHSHVAQTTFLDSYGHNMVDPWVNHFTRLNIKANFLHLTNNTSVHDVLWNTIASNGKKTTYAVERREVVSSDADDGKVSWESIGCRHVAVTFSDNVINRVYPWKAWGKDAKGVPLYAKVDRSGNSSLESGAEQEITLEFTFASSKGTAIPANVAVFKIPDDVSAQPLDTEEDVIRVRYAYTEYQHGPLLAEDESKLKFPDDATKITEVVPYDFQFDNNTLNIDGTFLKVGDRRIYSCDQLIGDCYTKAAWANERLARTSFVAGGLEDSEVKTNDVLIDTCAQAFDSQHRGQTFEDGVAASYGEAANRLTDMYLFEGSQHYSVIFKDETGRPIGTKNVAFLTQSALVQTRDVEIRYKWGAHMQHYPTNDGMILLATHHGPMSATQNRLVNVIQEYDPFCGDHQETTSANPLFRAFDLAIDKHGPLWYPYKRCHYPTYHANSSLFLNVVEYVGGVEGFDARKRAAYWERMRFFDQYMPAVMNFIPQLGCFWSEKTTTLNANRPVIFSGYTKVRSAHPFGPYASDRESLRLSRHWEKRNLSITEEVIEQEEDGLTVSLTQDFINILYDDDGNLKSGSELETPVWVHINDGLSVVNPASEGRPHPYTNLLMANVGLHSFAESFDDSRLPLKSVVVERDYTSSVDRAEDGSKIYLADGTELNVQEGYMLEQPGSDIRWVYAAEDTGWAWMASPPDPVRGAPRIKGLFLSNSGQVLFKKNLEPATYTTEGPHQIEYTPHEFDDSGAITSAASLSMDGGPELLISQTDGAVYILTDSKSPYDAAEHEGEDYTFVALGNGPGGAGILADSRGLQRYEVGGTKYATLAGININLVFDINELPHATKDLRSVGRLFSGDPEDEDDGGVEAVFEDLLRAYSADEGAPLDLVFDFKGHYYVEDIIFDFVAGKPSDETEAPFDVPALQVSGFVKEDGRASIDGVSSTVLFAPTSYIRGTGITEGTPQRKRFRVNSRLFRLTLGIGARIKGHQMNLQDIKINVREPEGRTEEVTLYEPRPQISTAETGTHKPSDLEFYFQRSYPDHAKNYLSGQLSTGDPSMGWPTQITAIAGTELKWMGRQVKDIVPQFEFSDPINNRFPYNNIDLSKITGYTEYTDASGLSRYVGGQIRTSSKGWTMYAGDHVKDPSGSLVSTDTSSDGTPNVFVEARPREELQEVLYQTGAALLGDKVAVFNGFWHPTEVEFFADAGVDLSTFSWTLQLRSEVAPVSRVFRHDNYGCLSKVTNENADGFVHALENWQAKGVFHAHCDPRFSYACLTGVMNKCEYFLFNDYGQPAYTDTDVVNRYTYTFTFPPRDYKSYFASGLINYGESGGIIGGTGPVGSAIAASAPVPDMYQLHLQYNATHANPYNTPQGPVINGPGRYQ